jgi:hypothetical protein
LHSPVSKGFLVLCKECKPAPCKAPLAIQGFCGLQECKNATPSGEGFTTIPAGVLASGTVISEPMAYKLTDKQRAFAKYFGVGFPKTTAARLAGYKDNGGNGIRVYAFRLAKDPRIIELAALYADAISYKELREFLRDESAPVDLYELEEWRGCSRQTKKRIATNPDNNVQAALDILNAL